MTRRKHYNSYTDQFKATAVALSNIKGVKALDVAESLNIHPVMLYRWRMEVRDGVIMAKKKDVDLDPEVQAELKELRKLKKAYKQLEMEHDLLKKAIQFSLERKKKSTNT